VVKYNFFLKSVIQNFLAEQRRARLCSRRPWLSYLPHHVQG